MKLFLDSGIIKILSTLAAAIIISFLINVTLLVTIVDPYLNDTNRVVNLFNFYELMKRTPGDKIFLCGSSQVAGDLDASVVENIIKNNNSSAEIFNLGYSGDTPLRRLTELNQILESEPKMVILGLTYYALNNSSFPVTSDSLALVNEKIKLDKEARSLFIERDLELMDMNQPYTMLYKRKFIIPSIIQFLKGNPLQRDDNIVDFKSPQTFRENLTRDLLLIRLNNSKDTLENYAVSSENNPEKKAIKYFISNLTSRKIHVIIINMPINPLLAYKISNQTRHNYANFLYNMSVPYYDRESSYSSYFFSDLTHLNEAGRRKFSEDVGKIILAGR